MFHQDVSSLLNLFYFHFVFIWSKGMTRLPRSRLSKRNEMNKNWHKHFSQPGKTKIIRIVAWLYGWGSLILSYHLAKIEGYRPCENGDIMFSICHLTQDRSVTWLCWYGLFILSHHPAKFGVHEPCEKGDVMFSICHVTTELKCHVILWVGFLYSNSPSY